MKPASAIMSEISSEHGGLLGALNAGELPRDQKQVYNARQHNKQCDKQGVHSSAKEKTDVLYYLMEQSRKCHDGIAFVRDVKAVPEPMCVLATEHQLDIWFVFVPTPVNFLSYALILRFA